MTEIEGKIIILWSNYEVKIVKLKCLVQLRSRLLFELFGQFLSFPITTQLALFNLALKEVNWCQATNQTYNILAQRVLSVLKCFNSCLLQLVGHLNDVVVDQIPSLGQLKEYLLRMQMQSFPDQPSSSSHAIIEQLPELRMQMEDLNQGKWSSIAKHQITHYFSPSDDDLQKLATKFVSELFLIMKFFDYRLISFVI